MIYYEDKKYSFVEYFDETTGFLARSNVFRNGIETDMEPHMRSFPELLDIGIMGHCDACSAGLCRRWVWTAIKMQQSEVDPI